MGNAKKYTGDQLRIGMTATRVKTITRQDIDSFGEISTDINPMHFDEEYASKTQFGQCIAHGLICLSFCNAILGMELPGLGAVLMSQESTFRAPVFVGDVITAKGEVVDIIYKEKKNFYIVKIKLTATNQDGVVVVDSIATVMPAKE